jgi:hypothetical protein
MFLYFLCHILFVKTNKKKEKNNNMVKYLNEHLLAKSIVAATLATGVTYSLYCLVKGSCELDKKSTTLLNAVSSVLTITASEVLSKIGESEK